MKKPTASGYQTESYTSINVGGDQNSLKNLGFIHVSLVHTPSGPGDHTYLVASLA